MMPGGDGTGPVGSGPMTGRAAGFCAGYPVPGYMNPIPGPGFRRIGYTSGFFGRDSDFIIEDADFPDEDDGSPDGEGGEDSEDRIYAYFDLNRA
jgi:hypothetical protein